MKIYISYFYKIRFFKPHMIPLSTAMSDPRWYHENQDKYHSYLDKRKVYNGLRMPQFVPNPMLKGLCIGADKCQSSPIVCNFLSAYKHQLDTTVDFDDVMDRFQRICDLFRNVEHIHDEPVIVLIVHEAPQNPCSERGMIQEWFKEHGVVVEELDIPNEKF